MIHLASDSRPAHPGWRPGPAVRPQPQAKDGRRVASHAWPFLSRPVSGPVAQGTSPSPRNDSGS